MNARAEPIIHLHRRQFQLCFRRAPLRPRASRTCISSHDPPSIKSSCHLQCRARRLPLDSVRRLSCIYPTPPSAPPPHPSCPRSARRDITPVPTPTSTNLAVQPWRLTAGTRRRRIRRRTSSTTTMLPGTSMVHRIRNLHHPQTAARLRGQLLADFLACCAAPTSTPRAPTRRGGT